MVRAATVVYPRSMGSARRSRFFPREIADGGNFAGDGLRVGVDAC